MKNALLAIPFGLVLAACGGSPSPEPAHPTQQTGEAHHKDGKETGEHHGEHHSSLSPELKAFHEVLAPVWHSKPEERTAKACDANSALSEKAKATKDEKLTTATEKITKTCADPSRAGVEAALKEAHDRFHALAEH